MALLCCFLLIVEKIPIVECERLYELTWSSAQSEGSKWPLDLQGLIRKRTAGTSRGSSSARKESDKTVQLLINEKACFELASTQDQLAGCDRLARAT